MNIPAGTIKRLHVDRAVVARNRKLGEHAPAITVQTSKGAHKGHSVVIHGPSLFVQSSYKPLPCGARLWVETKAAVTIYRSEP